MCSTKLSQLIYDNAAACSATTITITLVVKRRFYLRQNRNRFTEQLVKQFRNEHSNSHYNGVIMSPMGSQINSLTIVYSTVYSVADQRWPVNSPHNGPVTRKCVHLMTSSWVAGATDVPFIDFSAGDVFASNILGPAYHIHIGQFPLQLGCGNMLPMDMGVIYEIMFNWFWMKKKFYERRKCS